MEKKRFGHRLKTSSLVDMKFMSWMMGLLDLKGIKDEEMTLKEIQETCEIMETGHIFNEKKDKAVVQARVSLLLKKNLLKKRKMSRQEVEEKFGTSVRGGKRNFYLMGETGKKYLKKYGDFRNPSGYLMKKGIPIKDIEKQQKPEKEIVEKEVEIEKKYKREVVPIEEV